MKKQVKRKLKIAGLVIIPIIAAATIILGCASTPKSEKNSLHSIVRLHDKESGRFFCSGLVISPSVIITAAHCVQDRPNDVPTISVQATKASNIGVDATVLASNGRSDLAMLKGDFRIFSTRAIETDAVVINKLIDSYDTKLVACGFPWGGDLVCSPVKAPVRCFFSICASGYLYPGMSGGPVIDLKTGKAIALNTAVDHDGVILSPYINIFDILKQLPDTQ